jgi:uncharacterized spore protein YtfJ
MPNVDELLAGARDAMTVKRVFGDPIERNGVTVIPAAVVRGGAGGGGDSENNGGGGFGLMAKPIGVYVIRGEDVRWQPAVDPARGWQVVAGLGVLAAWAVARRMLRR